jgi:hypothetical protein
MNWIQIGDKAINFDRVLLIEFDEDDGTVALYPDISDVTSLVLWDDEAKSFRAWWANQTAVTKIT